MEGGRTRREDRGESSATSKADVPERAVARPPPRASVRTPGRCCPSWARTTAPCRKDGCRNAQRSPRWPARHGPCRGEPLPARHGGRSRTRGHSQCSQPGRQRGSRRSPAPTSDQREASLLRSIQLSRSIGRVSLADPAARATASAPVHYTRLDLGGDSTVDNRPQRFAGCGPRDTVTRVARTEEHRREQPHDSASGHRWDRDYGALLFHAGACRTPGRRRVIGADRLSGSRVAPSIGVFHRIAYAAFFVDVVVSIFSSRFNASRSPGRWR